MTIPGKMADFSLDSVASVYQNADGCPAVRLRDRLSNAISDALRQREVSRRGNSVDMLATGSPQLVDLRWRRLQERTPIAVAMALSTVINAALLAVLAANLALPIAPKERPPAPLVIMLVSPGAADDDGIEIAGAAHFETPGTDPIEAAADVPVAESGRATSAEPPVEALTPPEPEQRAGRPTPESFESSSAHAILAERSASGRFDWLPPPSAVAEAAAATPVVTAPEVPTPTVAFSPRQKNMLARKLHDWAESFHRSHEPDDAAVWKHKGQRYAARFTSLPGGDDTRPDRVAVRVTTEQNGNRLSTTMYMKRLAFSNYAQFVNRWDDAVQIHDDELFGRFHSNTEINLSYSRDVAPRFYDKVTTSARTVNITERRGHRSRGEIFLRGIETGITPIRLPRDYVPLPERMTIREEQIQEFADDTRIIFHRDGSYSSVSLESNGLERHGTIQQPASYLVATDKAELHVKGTVAGKVLVFSANRIVIIGDLVYATDPEGPGSNDYLGLVSGQSVEIARPAVTGPGDLHIQGAIYAKRLFRVRDHRGRGDGTLHIYGSLTAGSLSATEPRYATRIRFDPRLEYRRPPGFPVTDRYELESWEQAWIVHP